MEWKQATLTTLTVDQQQRDRCINYITFDAAKSLSVNWQRPKQLDKHEWSTAMENMERNDLTHRGSAAKGGLYQLYDFRCSGESVGEMATAETIRQPRVEHDDRKYG